MCEEPLLVLALASRFARRTRIVGSFSDRWIRRAFKLCSRPTYKSKLRATLIVKDGNFAVWFMHFASDVREFGDTLSHVVSEHFQGFFKATQNNERDESNRVIGDDVAIAMLADVAHLQSESNSNLFDPSESGPLGKYWPNGVPQWFDEFELARPYVWDLPRSASGATIPDVEQTQEADASESGKAAGNSETGIEALELARETVSDESAGRVKKRLKRREPPSSKASKMIHTVTMERLSKLKQKIVGERKHLLAELDEIVESLDFRRFADAAENKSFQVELMSVLELLHCGVVCERDGESQL